MRKLFIFLILGILLATPLISAADWDNKLAYSENDLKVTISNSFLLLFPTSEIGTAELKSHPSVNYVLRVGAGNQVVMWYDFNFLELYLNGLGKVEFTDIRTGKEIERDYSFVYWGEKERDVYDCEYSFSTNGTKVCNSVVVGKETYNDWLPYNSKDIPKRNIRIGLMTSVEVDDKIDGVWTIAGKKVKKHAEWDASLDVGLVACWNFNELSGTALIDVVGNKNLTNTGMTINQTEAIEGTSYAGGDGKYVKITSGQGNITDFTEDFTISTYLYHNALTTWTGAFNSNPANKGFYFLIGANGNAQITLPGHTSPTMADGTFVTGTWQNLVVTYDVDNLNWSGYVDKVSKFSESQDWDKEVGGFMIANDIGNEATRGMDGYADMTCVWNRTLTYEEATTYDMIYSVLEELKIVSLSPEDEANFTTNIINFSANVSDVGGVGIQNVTLEVFNSTSLVFNETNTSTLEGVYNFSDTFSDEDYDWNVTAYDDSNEDYSSATRSFSIDTTDPVISVIYPNETITFHQLNTNLSLNWSINDTHLDSCWFNWNSSNVSITCEDNSTTFNITDGTVKTLTLYANDTFGREASQEVTWDYRLLLIYEIYDEEILEGLSTTFSANFLTNGSTITLANLSYNSLENMGTINNHGGNNFTVTETLTVPSVSEDTNISFYWNITQGTMYHALDAKNQTILNLGIDDCTVNNEVLYNFTIVDERTQTKLIAAGNKTDAKVDMEIRGFGTTTLIEQFNKSYSQINPFAVCFNSTEGQFNIDVQVQYGANGYEIEFYHIQNATINSTNFPTNITLFDLNTSKSQLFKLIVKDSSFLAVKDALVEVHRKYIEEGVFKIVEIPRTDAKGETAAHLVIQDAIYNFIIKKYGVTIASFENVIAVCQTPLVTPCTIDFNAFAETVTVPDFEEAEDFLFTLGFNSSSRVISSVFSIPSGTPSVVAIEVIKEDALGTSVCTDTLTSTSGTLNCNVGANVGNSTVLAKIYRDGNLQAQGQVKLDQSPIDIYGGVLVILALLIMMTLIGAGISDNPVYSVLFLMVGVIFLFALNLVASSGFIGATATILWLIIAVILLIIKGGRRS